MLSCNTVLGLAHGVILLHHTSDLDSALAATSRFWLMTSMWSHKTFPAFFTWAPIVLRASIISYAFTSTFMRLQRDRQFPFICYRVARDSWILSAVSASASMFRVRSLLATLRCPTCLNKSYDPSSWSNFTLHLPPTNSRIRANIKHGYIGKILVLLSST